MKKFQFDLFLGILTLVSGQNFDAGIVSESSAVFIPRPRPRICPVERFFHQKGIPVWVRVFKGGFGANKGVRTALDN